MANKPQSNFNTTHAIVASFFSQCQEVFEMGDNLAAASLRSDLDAIHDSLNYCALLLFSQVTERALVQLVSNILKEKGSQPVGEVGKLLQDVTDNRGISTTIKEKFKGLKNF